MTRKINLTPIPWPVGAASAAAIFALIWLLSRPGMQIFDASRLSVISIWTGALAVLCLLYIKRYALALWLHGALAACFWTRIFAGADRERARAFGPYGLGEQLNWIITDDWDADPVPFENIVFFRQDPHGQPVVSDEAAGQ